MAKVDSRIRDLNTRIDAVLTKPITKQMIFDLLRSGSSLYQQGRGFPYPYVGTVIDDRFKLHGVKSESIDFSWLKD